MNAKELLEKYRNDLCSEQEKRRIEKWFLFHNAAAPSGLSDDDLSDLQRKDFTKLESKIVQKKKSPYLAPVKWSIAAILFFCLVSGALYISRHPGHISDSRDVLPGTNMAFLTLSNGQRINLSQIANGTIAEQANIQISKTGQGQVSYLEIAGNGVQKSNATNTIETPKAGQYQINLPDGTKVWLNADSKLTYPVALTENGTREVTLSGEAYFQVAKAYTSLRGSKTKQSIPFIVHTRSQEVRVLGTHFNINSYNEEPETITTLEEGSVEVVMKSSLAQSIEYPPLRGSSPQSLRGSMTKQPKTVILKPGEQAATGRGQEIQVSPADLQTAMAWKEGRMYFKQADIKAIMRQVSRWYDVDILYAGEVPERQITGGFDRNAKLSAVVKTLEQNGIVIKTDYRRNGTIALIVQP
ncbi:FecR domain-containing protein [Chitinophaga sp. CC14]|uniref:FecR family protein n=1 Tax=Chitinophaga sp. CC14 TaxID=3029199 RepID=UPI003B7B7EB3